MQHLMSSKGLRVFVTVVRLGSFKAAAEELRLTPSAVSHQIRAMEADLGRPMFHRSPRKVKPTAAALAYYERVKQAFDTLDSATAWFRGARDREILTVHSTPSFATQCLMPRLADFMAQHSEIDLRFSASADSADLVRDDIDVDIRYGPIAPRGEHVVEIAEERIVPLVSPKLLAEAGPVAGPGDLMALPLIHSTNCLVRWQDWGRTVGVRPDMVRGLRFDRSFMSIAAATDALGVALESTMLAERELADGRLVAPFPASGLDVRGHRMVVRSTRAQAQSVRTFVDFVVQSMAPLDATAAHATVRPG